MTIRLFAGIVSRMAARTSTTIRPFDGSLASAEGLLGVEQAVFDECPYSAEQVRIMLIDGPQRAWLALSGDTVIGFVIAFPTAGLQDPLWEIDLLAVHPQWRGRRLGTRLIRAASAWTEGIPQQARAYVATDNNASAQAFTRAGLRPGPETYTLLIYRTAGTAMGKGGQTQPPPGVTVRETHSLFDAAEPFPGYPLPDDSAAPNLEPGPQPDSNGFPKSRNSAPLESEAATLPEGDGNLTVLQAEKDGQPAGYAALVGVQTLLYRGVWIEAVEAQDRAAREALIHGAVTRGMMAGIDEVGAMVEARAWPLKNSLLAAGFRSLGEFRRYTANLPLPGLADNRSETL